VLDIVFVSYVVCHKPVASLLPLCLDPLKKEYSNAVDTLKHIFRYTLSILQERKFSVNRFKRKEFSINSFKRKDLTRIRDIAEIFDMSTILDANIIIIERGEEV